MTMTLGAMMDPAQAQGMMGAPQGGPPPGIPPQQMGSPPMQGPPQGPPQKSPQQFAMDLRRAMMAPNKLMSISQLVEDYGMPPSMVSKLLQGDPQDDNAGENADAANAMAGDDGDGNDYESRAENFNEDSGYPLTDTTSRHPGHMSPDEADAYYDTPEGKARLRRNYGPGPNNPDPLGAAVLKKAQGGTIRLAPIKTAR